MAKIRQFGEDESRRIAKTVKAVERFASGNPFQAYSKSFDDYLPGPIPFIVDLVKVGGSAGSGTTDCTFTYDIYRFGTTDVLQNNVGPLKPRDSHTQYIEATQGLAYQELDGTLQLAEAYEKIATDTCDGADIGFEYLP